MKGSTEPAGDEALSPDVVALPPVWREILAGAALLQQQALDSLDLAAVVVALPSGVITAANAAAATLLERPVAEIVGQVRPEVFRFDNEREVRRALNAITDGTVEAYRARRRLVLPSGRTREMLTWGRAATLMGSRTAIFIMVPAGSPRNDAPPLVWIEPLVIGTADAQWQVTCVSTDVPEVLGGTQQEFIGCSLLAIAHPDDVGDLLRVATGAARGETVCRNVRLRHHDGSWARLHLGVVPLTDEKPPPLGFVLLPLQPEFTVTPTQRLNELEDRLRHIVAELRSAGPIDGIENLPTASDHPELNRLSTRQWQILIRLLRGDRVPTIARDLFLSTGTVRNHLAGIYSQFDVHSQAELLEVLRKP